ncbi:Glyoxalase/Bleomycin resistance protein/Dioxygenase superfamily protein [Micromonospora pallida]|uniref:Glyoxalase/Bleomycin resistance protein/Dioxygenase superfamily protein n=1 Tax=Micromonospora pallida TaxID=145854 RepID=A0A1C6SHZ2_9ACTN|nr:VOC family protein [Micromonospora pallida]SCL28968.1 Glyoxalase/Bleomycin resistance protein/Dioxygenase superfamily protein [Micromonospora pallida]
MAAPLIEHIGILVPNLEEAIERWTAATGYTFSPIARYRTQRYCDSSDPQPHFHDARISFSQEGPPRIELMEFTGDGTHSAAQAGVHHFGFPGTEDVPGRIAELAAQGIGEDGKSLTEDGRVHLWFTDKKDLDGVRLEYISPFPGPSWPTTAASCGATR